MKKKLLSYRIEQLESRDNPSVTISPDGRRATYIDYDSDKVTVTVSKGFLTQSMFEFDNPDKYQQLQRLNLSGGGFDGSNVTFTASGYPGGDGLVDVGFIDSTGHDLGNVIVRGDLARIAAGDANAATQGLGAVSVRSLGVRDLETQSASGSMQSDIIGAVRSLSVTSNLKNAYFLVHNEQFGSIGSVNIGGSIIGGDAANSGRIYCEGNLPYAKIGGDIRGGSKISSGYIGALGNISTITVSGSLIGGDGQNSGVIFCRGGISPGITKGKITIGKNIIGGGGIESGNISAYRANAIFVGGTVIGGTNVSAGSIRVIDVGSVTVGGSVIGGSSDNTGAIIALGKIGSVSVAHDLIGGSCSSKQSCKISGSVFANKSIGSVKIGGSLICGNYTEDPEVLFDHLAASASIIAGYEIGSVTVLGSLIGNFSHAATIAAYGKEFSNGKNDLAIGSISIYGNMEHSEILAGVVFVDGVSANGPFSGFIAGNADAQIGSLTVRGDWMESTMAAGVEPKFGSGYLGYPPYDIQKPSGDTYFGVLVRDESGVNSKIGVISVLGSFYGPSDSSFYYYGICSQSIISISFHNLVLPLNNGAGNDTQFLATHTFAFELK